MSTLFWVAIAFIATPVIAFMASLAGGLTRYIVNEWNTYDTEEKAVVLGSVSLLIGLILLLIHVVIS